MQTAMWADKISLLLGTQADPADGGCTKLWVQWAVHLKVAEVLSFGGCRRPDGVDPHLQARVSFRRCSDQTRPVHALERRDRHRSTSRVSRAGCPLSPYASGWYFVTRCCTGLCCAGQALLSSDRLHYWQHQQTLVGYAGSDNEEVC